MLRVCGNLMIISRLKSKSFWIPTVLFFLFLISFVIVMQTGQVKYYGVNRTLSQWDGQHYLEIARDGYQKFPCAYNPSYICGNVGWFPFYPLLGWIFSLGGLVNVDWTLLIISWLACWLALLLLFDIVKKRTGPVPATYTILAVLLYPASFYFLTTFPYSVYLLMAVCLYIALDRHKYKLVWPLTFLLAVTYPSGIVTALPVAYTLFSRWEKESWRDRIWLAAGTAAPVAGLVCYGLYYLVKFGDFFLYQHFQAQGYYAHEISFPFKVVYDTLKYQNYNSPILLILIFVITTLLLFYTRKVSVRWQVFMFAVLLFTPTFGTTDCYYRHVVVAFPLFMMVGYSATSFWRRLLFPVYLIAGLFLMWKFFVPMFKLGGLM